MCCRKGTNWYFEQATVDSTVQLVKELMAKYNIPVENVIRHYDVSGKHCPEPYVRDTAAWKAFKDKLSSSKIPENSVNKSVETVAREVIRGLWGNGTVREARLTAAGYNYYEVQSLVNKLLKKKQQLYSNFIAKYNRLIYRWGGDANAND